MVNVNKPRVIYEKSIDMDFNNMNCVVGEISDNINKNFDKWLKSLISAKLNISITEDYDINQLKGRVKIEIDGNKKTVCIDGEYAGHWQFKAEPSLTSRFSVYITANPTFDMQ
jgi:hypothetical protein